MINKYPIYSVYIEYRDYDGELACHSTYYKLYAAALLKYLTEKRKDIGICKLIQYDTERSLYRVSEGKVLKSFSNKERL